MPATEGFDVRKDVPKEILAVEVDADFKRFIFNTLPHLSTDQIKKLKQALPSFQELGDEGEEEEEDDEAYGANFSVAEELTQQIRMVKAMRKHYFPNGRIRAGSDIKELKEIIATTNTMLKTLMANHEDVMSMERQRCVESALVETLQELATPVVKEKLGFDICEAYLNKIEERLEAIK